MGFFVQLQEITFFLCVSEYKISNHNVLDQIQVLPFNLEGQNTVLFVHQVGKTSSKRSAQHHHLQKRAKSCSFLQAPYELWMWQQASGNILL